MGASFCTQGEVCAEGKVCGLSLNKDSIHFGPPGRAPQAEEYTLAEAGRVSPDVWGGRDGRAAAGPKPLDVEGEKASRRDGAAANLEGCCDAALGWSPGQGSDFAWTSYFSREAAELKRLPVSPRCASPGSCLRARRKHIFESGSVYDGEWLGNQRSGMGSQTWLDGAAFQGEWSQNTATGQGRFRHCDGDVYVGQWRQSMAHGLGVYQHHDGTTYAGEFFDDIQDGYGVERWADNAQFTGYFSRGKKNGPGVYVWPDGSRYEGEWLENQIHGYGVYTGVDGRQFRGQWEASAMHGLGHYCWCDGRSFAGQYAADQKCGFGVFQWPNGHRYEGYWTAGSQHGIGRYCAEACGDEARLARWSRGRCVGWADGAAGDPEDACPWPD